MIQNNISLSLIFFEGLLSFFSPCILPLLPVYISYLAGATIEEINHDKALKRTMIINAFGFTLGISFVFILLGAGASGIGRAFIEHEDTFRKVSSILIIFFGLISTGIIRLKALNYEKRFKLRMKSPKFINALLLGVTFSFGWTPCIGPILGSVLFIASTTNSVIESMSLLLVYSAGLTIPFLLTTMLIGAAMRQYKKIFKYFNIIKIVSGCLLIIMGILMYFDLLTIFAKI